MWKKLLAQTILLLIIFVSIFFVYKIYFKKENIIETKVEEEKLIEFKKNTKIVSDVNSNLIEDLQYISEDSLGNEYIIRSEYSELNLDNVNIISMKNVNAKITMINSDPMFVTSEFAEYNNKTYETIFTDNVVINYLDSKIMCEKFKISIENNFAYVSDDVIYENLKTKLEADTIEIDLITKNSKIFMKNENKKIKIFNK